MYLNTMPFVFIARQDCWYSDLNIWYMNSANILGVWQGNRKVSRMVDDVITTYYRCYVFLYLKGQFTRSASLTRRTTVIGTIDIVKHKITVDCTIQYFVHNFAVLSPLLAHVYLFSFQKVYAIVLFRMFALFTHDY